jgi:NADH:ubiquinone oxidoreductase subunit H
MSGYSNIFIIMWRVLYVITVLLELNRAPFDLSEGERELVRGYNVDYMSTGFVLFFLKEYGRLIFFRVLIRILYFEGRLLVSYIIISLLLFLRSCFPRVRYDVIIRVSWFIILPVVINFLLVVIIFS